MLYVVATPIGNMADITLRALEILKQVTLIACEDTRHTRKILSHYDIHTPCVSCHSYNEHKTFEKHILPVFNKGGSVALVSDSGTPLISDPGASIVDATFEHGFPVSPIPGASAVSAVVSISGLHGKGFWFEGFLGRKTGQRMSRLRVLLERNEPFVLFESPYRIVKLMGEITDIESTRKVLFAREITKKFESIQKMQADMLYEYWKKEEKRVKGECIILVYPGKK